MSDQTGIPRDEQCRAMIALYAMEQGNSAVLVLAKYGFKDEADFSRSVIRLINALRGRLADDA